MTSKRGWRISRKCLAIAVICFAALQGCVNVPPQATRDLVKPRFMATPTVVPPCGAVSWLARAKELAQTVLSDPDLRFERDFMSETKDVVEHLMADPSCRTSAINLDRGVFLLNNHRLEELVK